MVRTCAVGHPKGANIASTARPETKGLGARAWSDTTMIQSHQDGNMKRERLWQLSEDLELRTLEKTGMQAKPCSWF